MLLGGLGLLAGGTLLAALAPGRGWLFPIVALMGVGNGVFHPADFAILNANVAPRRLGHAYSTHGVGGNLGYALSPIVSFALGAAFGWRVALAAMGVGGLVALGVLARAARVAHVAPRARTRTRTRWRAACSCSCSRRSRCASLFRRPDHGLRRAADVPAVGANAGFAVPLASATSAVTAYLLGGTAGIVAGGFLATRTTRHDRVAGAGPARRRGAAGAGGRRRGRLRAA